MSYIQPKLKDLKIDDVIYITESYSNLSINYCKLFITGFYKHGNFDIVGYSYGANKQYHSQLYVDENGKSVGRKNPEARCNQSK